jgi:type I restriction enzyme, S subunit
LGTRIVVSTREVYAAILTCRKAAAAVDASFAQKGVAVRGINVGDVRLMEIPLPPRAEQREIVHHIEGAFNWINRLILEAASARKLIEHLDQSILAKAFRGELVPQNPNDEPASVLLERIKAERQTSGHRGRTGGSP